jgi:hypothetical protein
MATEYSCYNFKNEILCTSFRNRKKDAQRERAMQIIFAVAKKAAWNFAEEKYPVRHIGIMTPTRRYHDANRGVKFPKIFSSDE